MNKILNYITIENITSKNRLLKAAGYAVARKLGFKTKVAKPQETRQEKKIKGKTNSLRKNPSYLAQ